VGTYTSTSASVSQQNGTFVVRYSDNGRVQTTCPGGTTDPDPDPDPASALIEINPGAGIAASTFSASTLLVTNTGGANAPSITNVTIDITGSLIPDATFDPNGDAGDATAKCVDVSSEGGTGYAVPADNCTDPFSVPHEDEPGVIGNGFDALALDFTDFDSGEVFAFAVDIDPTSIQGVPGAGGAGSISGLELSGSTVTVTFSDGEVLTNNLFGDGSAGGSVSSLVAGDDTTAPTGIELVGVASTPTVFINDSKVALVGATGQQTVQVSGPVGAAVELLVADAELLNPTGFDIDAYETDNVSAVAYLEGTIGAAGTVDFVVDIADSAVLYTFLATIDAGANGSTSDKLIVTVQSPAAALVQVTPGGSIDATTFGDAKITLTNNGDVNAPAIESITFDLRGSLIPDVTFDPVGTAGDEGTQCLAVSSEGGTGFVVPADPCTDPFSIDHEDEPGVAGNGFDGMTLDFTDFGFGETIVFGVDIDPTTIQGVAGAGGAGAVSGLELTGSSVTIVFSDGQVITNQIFGDGTAGGGESVLATDTGLVAPTGIELVGVATMPTVFPNNSEVAVVTAVGAQTVQVTGPAGANVTLLAVDAELQNPDGFDIDEFEPDAAIAVEYLPGVFDVNGVAEFTVDIADPNLLYHFVATVDDGANGSLTDILIVTVAADDPPTDVLFRVNSGGAEVADPNGGIAWSEDNSTNAGGGTVAGAPSQYLVSGTNNAFATTDSIDVTDPSVPAGTPAALFQSERFSTAPGNPISYEFPVGSGQDYTVDLYFAEIFLTADDLREFTINVEGVDVAADFDIHEQVGHDTGLVVSFTTPVADDFLTITFVDEPEDNPKVNAIEVRVAGPPPTDVSPTITAITDKTVTADDSLVVPVATTETDGDPVTISVSSTPTTDAFTTFVDNGDGTATLTFDPATGDVGVYTVVVEASDKDGSVSEAFNLTVAEVAQTVFARINSAGPELPAVGGGPVWDADTTAANHPTLVAAGSNNASGSAAVAEGPTVPPTVNGDIFHTERYSTSGMAYAVDVPAGTNVFVRLFVGNNFGGTATAGSRVFDISIDGNIVEDDFDIIPRFGNQTGGMLEYLITSDGTVDIAFTGVVENPLVNGIEVVAADSSPGALGVAPNSIDFGVILSGDTATETVTLSNLGFDAADPTINVAGVSIDTGEFTTDFAGPVAIAADGSATFEVTFAPTSNGTQSATATITHDGTNSPTTVALTGEASSVLPVAFGSSGLAGESLNNPTSLDFGPDDRLYVAQQDGTIKAYTVVRNGADDYDVVATETINLIKTETTNHNDDGTAIGSQNRQMTGMLATGTAANPVLYVSSSDSRISVGTDSGLDTNSGVISRLTFNGTTWDKVDIVRGLPRSEENHSTNGMDIDEATNTLFVMQGGHANKGAPGNNFSGTPEYYLSAALLSVDLDAIDAAGTFIDARDGSEVGYDLRTLDDPTRPNITNADATFPYPAGHPLFASSIDIGDPFGGNNSLNQAIPEPGGPVQIYSPGYRNAFDVVFTSQGRLYTSDNGPNTGWGGTPATFEANGDPVDKGAGPYTLDAGQYCTNQFKESGSQNHGDTLQFISGPGYYGGHPTPIRAFPGLAGVVNYEQQGGNWVLVNDEDFFALLPSDIPAGFFGDNPIECDYQANNSAEYLDIVGASTNGIAEYTAGNFGGALQGNILTASFDGKIRSYALNAAGDDVDEQVDLFSGFGSQPLDVIAQGDTDLFPGTVWAVTYGANNITVFEPADQSACVGTDDINLDEDGDGYSNADEIDSGTNPCSAGDKPTDNDNDNLSDLNDADDDDDGIDDVDDEFAVDPNNGLTTDIPVLRPFENGDPGTFLFGLGLTGLMTNGVDTYLEQFDPETLAAGGNGGELGIEVVTTGDAFQGVNTQENAFQYGIDADTATDPFVVTTEVTAPIFEGNTPANFQSMGLQVGAGDQDNYLKVVINANGGNGGVQVLKEVDGTATQTNFSAAAVGADVLTADSSVTLSLVIDPSALTAQPRAQVDAGPVVDLGGPIAIPAAWLDPADENGFAVGVISTSSGATPFATLFARLDVEVFVPGNVEPTITATPDTVTVEDGESIPTIVIDAADADAGDTLTVTTDGNEPAGITLNDDGNGTVTLTGTPTDGPGTFPFEVTVSDGTASTSVTVTIEVTAAAVNEAPVFDVALTDDTAQETNAYSQQVQASDANLDTITYSLSGDVPAGMTISASGLIEWTPDLTGSGIYDITVSLDDGVAPAVSDDFTLSVSQTDPAGSPLFRVNAGGPNLAAADASFPDWEQDTNADPSPYYVGGGTGTATGAVNDVGHPTVPQSAPNGIYTSERYGDAQYEFPVVAGTEIEVRVHLNETFAAEATTRSFDIVIDGNTVQSAINPTAQAGAQNTAIVFDYLITSDGVVDVDLVTVTDNAAVKAIEIIGVSGVPGVLIENGLDGTTLDTNAVTLEWLFNGFDNGTGIDHAHVSISSDGGATFGPADPVAGTVNPGGTHNTVYRPTTSIDITGLADGDYIARVQVADAGHQEYANGEATATAAFTVATVPAGPITTRINAGGALVTATDGGPDWAADDAGNVNPLLTTPSGSTADDWAVQGYDASVPTYAQSAALFGFERYDGSNGAAPDDMTYSIPVSAAGASATVNLFVMNGWNGTDMPGERLFDVYIEGVLVLDEFDITATYGDQIGGLQSFAATDDGDGVITIVFEHGTGPQNPLVNAIEVIG